MQFSQLHQLMENDKIFKCLPHNFALALTVSEIYKFGIVYLQKVGNGHGVQFSKSHLLMANVKVDKCLPYIFAIALTVSQVKLINCLP